MSVNENVVINFRETGLVLIKRRLDEMSRSVYKATKGLWMFEKALAAVGAGLMLNGLVQSLDMLTNMENRIKLTTGSLAEMQSVQQQLFEVANRSRTDVEAIGELYNRTALNVQALGVSTQETVRFTESLAKATIISGASAREANAAMIQLSQGMASNRLSGDELRSVLEQLPFVADVIAKELTRTGQFGEVGRGELRELGTEGKITAEQILAAFRNSASEIDALFAQMDITIGQSLIVANNKMLQAFDSFDDATGFSNAVAKSIIKLADYIDDVLFALLGLGAALAAAFGMEVISRIGKMLTMLRGLATAMVAQRAATLANARASALAAAATSAEAHSEMVLNGTHVANLQLERAQALQQLQNMRFTVANGRARNILTGQYINQQAVMANMIRVGHNLTAVDMQLANANIHLARSVTASNAAMVQATATQNALAAATARNAAATTGLAARFPLLTGAALGTRNAFAMLFRVGRMHPFLAIAAAIGALVVAFVRWGNVIKVTQDGVVGLKDFTVAAFQLMGEAVMGWARAAGSWIHSMFIAPTIKGLGMLWDGFVTVLSAIGSFLAAVTNFWIGVFIGTVNGILAAWSVLPAGLEGFAVTAANLVIAAFEWMAQKAVDAINFIIRGVNSLVDWMPAQMKETMGLTNGLMEEFGDVTLARLQTSAGDTGAAAGQEFMNAFSSAMGQDYVGMAGSALYNNIIQPIIDRARANIAAAEAAAKAATQGVGSTGGAGRDGSGAGADGKKGGGSKDKTFNELLAEILKETEVARLSNQQREITQGLIKMEEELKRSLTQAERELAAEALRNLQIAKEQGAVLDELRGPQENFQTRLAAINDLMARGVISADEYTRAMRALMASNDALQGNGFMDGIRHGIANVAADVDNFSKDISGWVQDSLRGIGGIVTEVANSWNNTSELGISKMDLMKDAVRGFLHQVFQQLLQIATNQLIAKMLMSLGMGAMGVPAPVALPGLATGGSILPSGPGNTDSQLVAFMKRPDERVDVLTPGQQASQRKRMSEGGQSNGGSNVTQVNVAAVIRPNDIVGAFQQGGGEAVVLDILSKNRSTVKSILS